MVRRLFFLVKTLLYTLKFKKIGIRSIIENTLLIEGAKYIEIGNRVHIYYKAWISAVPIDKNSLCKIIIQDGCAIGNFCHIYATKSIIIEKNALLADKVYLSDNLHEYADVSLPVIQQHIRQIGEVIIGEGAWLGENVCVLGAKVGKNSVIGANSVVTKDIPDYSIAVGAPARVIKRYCFDEKQWKLTDKDGNFNIIG